MKKTKLLHNRYKQLLIKECVETETSTSNHGGHYLFIVIEFNLILFMTATYFDIEDHMFH